MKVLNNILPLGIKLQIIGSADIEISKIAIDSRKVVENCLFAAIPGSLVDGHQFIDKAIQQGAIAVLCEKLPTNLINGICYLVAQNAAACVGQIAAAFYGNPSKSLELIGITGTNGKTTVSTILKNACTSLGFKCGLISTVQIEIGDEIIPATHTTPDSITLQETLAKMLDANCSHVFMEVSSHALSQFRTAGVYFRGAVFTNLTHDHLDYHKTFDNYLRAKKSLFDGLSSSAFALINSDDKNGMVMLQNTKAIKLKYSLNKLADYKAKILEQDLTGMLLDINGHEFYTTVSGLFNAYNLAASYGVLEQLGFENDEILIALSKAKGAEGRLDWILGKNEVVGIVDYAHTPDALENVLKTIKQMNAKNGNIITVIGCGGNRDVTKRPIMAKIAAENSNRVILTSDNPRNEDPDNILNEMEAGIPIHKRMNCLTITDRKNAIKTACSFAVKGDLILVAGKGHEKYQEIKGQKHPFDDKAVLKEFLTKQLN